MLRQVGNVEAHATGVSSVIASNKEFPDDPDATFGVAPETTLHRAGSTGSINDIKNALSWALDDAEADVVNSSLCNGTTNTNLTDFDWFYDYNARLFSRLLVNASGNKGSCTNTETVQPPARGWNVLTVGAYDHDTSQMWADSQWQNPSSGNEKPDVVAPGVDINYVGVGGNYGNSTGTSLAAPQVTGIAALLIEQHPELRNNPTALKAILMATATNNILLIIQ
jgi:subtilisin family serine protease